MFRKYFSFSARLKKPKDPVLDVLPFVLSKGILLIFNDKFKEKFASLIKCSDANTDKLAKEMAEADAASAAAEYGSTIGGKLTKERPREVKNEGLQGNLLSSENMLYMFCLGLFNSNDVEM